MWENDTFYQIPRILTVHSIHTAFHIAHDEHFSFEGEMHNFWELVFISEGKASIAKDNRIFNLGSGDIAFHRPMEFHRLLSNGSPFRVLVISFAADGEILERLAEGVFTLELAQQNALMALLRDIEDAFTKDGIVLSSHGEFPASVQAVALHLELFLLDILKLDGLEKKADKTRSARDFSRVVEIMNQHIGENVSVPELARLANLSVSNLKKIFQKYAGTGVSKHFTSLKIIRATQLLESGLTVSEVSEQLGFSSQNYFSYVFRRETGRLPKTFKRL